MIPYPSCLLELCGDTERGIVSIKFMVTSASPRFILLMLVPAEDTIGLMLWTPMVKGIAGITG